MESATDTVWSDNWGFPSGRSPVGDLATSTMRLMFPEIPNMGFTRIEKGCARSYYPGRVDGFRVFQCVSMLDNLGFRAQGWIQGRISTNEMAYWWTIHAGVTALAVRMATEWKRGERDLEAMICNENLAMLRAQYQDIANGNALRAVLAPGMVAHG
jgi:hypothetical protein